MMTTKNTVRWRRRAVVSTALMAVLGGVLAAPVPALAAPEVPTEPVVSTANTTWKYLDDGSDPMNGAGAVRGWTAPGFDDTAWKSAQGSFGAKSGKLAAVGPLMPNTLLNHYLNGTGAPTVPSYQFRTTFELQPGVANEVGSIIGDVVYDDALVVWVNGTKVAGFVDERVTESTNQEYAGNSGSDPVSSSFTVNPELLVDGTNTVAIALYQDRATSSDIYLDVPSLRLLPVQDPGTPVVAPPTRVILTPTTTPETSQSFSWLAGDASHASGQVQIRAAAGGETRTVDAYMAGAVNNNPKPHYSATVTGLSPATTYSYRVGLEGSWGDWKTFTTANPAATDFQFIYYGDAQIGLDTTWPEVVRQAEAKATRSVGSVHAGDLIDTGSNETQWNNWFTGMTNSAASTNVMAAPGNHEYSGDKKLAAWKANFEYPHNNPSTATIGAMAELAVGDSDVARQYAAYFAHWSDFAAETAYYTDYQGVRFITLNATRDSAFLTPDNLPACTGAECPSTKVSRLWTEFQGAWLDKLLTDTPSKWNVVTFHQPVFSTSAGRDEPVLREIWVPIFQKHNIDLVLMGHDHTYGRGYINDDRTETAGITDGPVYAVSNSGAKHYDLETDAKNVWTKNNATQVLRGQGVTTYQVIDVSKGQLVYRSYLAEKTSDSTTTLPIGALYDEFTITKTDAGQKWVTEAGVTPPEVIPPVDPNVPPTPVDAASLNEQNRGGVTAPATAKPGDTITVELGASNANATVWPWLYSTPTSLGKAAANASGRISTVVPSNTAVGDHRIVVQAADGALLGWAPLRVAAATPGGDGGTGNGSGGSGGSGGSTAGGTSGSAASNTGSLASTGAEISTAVLAAFVLLLVGGFVALAAARRRRPATETANDLDALN